MIRSGVHGGGAERDRTGRARDRTGPRGRHDQRRPGAPGPGRTPRPHEWFAELLLLVLSGQSPVHRMLGHTIGPAYEQLVELAPGAPLRPVARVRPVLRECGHRVPAPGVVEAFARISAGDRLAAMAFRLERGPDLRWRCAAVEIGPRG
ncbi:Rv3235 family protein [Streptomyces sp. NPDC089919]|uniref:Rv3235 family protein n=1 Tax=Streptomyces sp. NPDC089919 TaxID=3155188 RepID=UPI0034146AAD